MIYTTFHLLFLLNLGILLCLRRLSPISEHKCIKIYIVLLPVRNAGDIPFCAFCVAWLYARCSFAPLKAWVDPVRGGCRAGPHPSVTGRSLSCLISSALCRQQQQLSNLGSSGEDLTECPGAQVLSHLYNTKNIVYFSVGSRSQSLFNKATSH